MRSEIITDEPTLLIRRTILEPGQATPWHTDSCRRFTVIVAGRALRIEYRDGEKVIPVDIRPGMVDWDEPEPRVHRAVNVGSTTFEEIVTFLRSSPDQDPQPTA